MARSPYAVTHDYIHRIWNRQETHLVRELCADPLVRHDAQKLTRMSHEQQIKRIAEFANRGFTFSDVILTGDETYATSVWNLEGDHGLFRKCGIEIFKVANGRITDVWNSAYLDGHWPDVRADEPALLAAIDDITPEWLRQVLRPHVAGDVPHISAIQLEPVGAGNASDTRRLLIRYSEPTTLAPASLICKFAPQDTLARERASTSGTFAREAAALKMVAAHSACRIARPYLLAGDLRGINLVMEDLTHTAVAGDQIGGCSGADASAVIDELAALHQAFADLRAEQAPQWMLRMTDVAQQWGAGIAAGAELARDRFGDRLSTADYRTISRAGVRAAGWLRYPAERPTLTHGDPRVDNILFEKRDGHTRAVLIDWQMAGLRSPMYDVAYFLSSSLLVEVRRREERALLERYLANTPEVTESAALAAYRYALLGSFTLTLLSIAALPRLPHVDLLLLTLLERNIAAVSDWDSLSAIETMLARGSA